MDCKRQHYIPRFMLAGFASRQTKDEIYSWVYPKDKPPFETNTKNIGSENYFYNLDDDASVDRSITAEETGFANLVNLLRKGELCEGEKIAELISHFEIRTKHFRQSFETLFRDLFLSMCSVFGSKEFIANTLGSVLKENPHAITDLIAAGMNPSETNIIMNIMRPHLSNMEELSLSASEILNDHFSELVDGSKDMVKTAHVKTLKKFTSQNTPLERLDAYKNMYFSLKKPSNEKMILGDSIALFRIKGDRNYKPFLEKDDTLLTVYIPLDTKTLLIGARNQDECIIPSDLTTAIASCSAAFLFPMKRHR